MGTCAAPEEGIPAHASVLSPEVAVALNGLPLIRNSRPNGVPTRVPSPAPWCPQLLKSEYAVPACARLCTPLPRPGNAVYRETGIEGSNPSRSAFVMSQDIVDTCLTTSWTTYGDQAGLPGAESRF
jgi:hypothetical protein